MATITRNSNASAKVTSPSSPNKPTRLISKDLDRSLSQVSKRHDNIKTQLKTHTSRRGSLKPHNKFHGRLGKKFKNSPSNYEANMKITHTLNRPLNHGSLTLRPKGFPRTGPYSKRPVAVNALALEHIASTLHRNVIHQYRQHKPDSRASLHAQRVRNLRLAVSYPPARPLVSRAAHVRASMKAPLYTARASRPVFWTAKKRSTLLYVPDARGLGRRTRRKSKPRVGVTASRAQLAKQLIRKFRATSGAKHAAVRRRLIRFRWFNRKFLKTLKYTFRRRLLRRSIRRAARYLQTSISVLTGASRRQGLLRNRFHAYRYLAHRGEVAANVLLHAQRIALSQRQQLLGRQHLTRKFRASRLLETRSRFTCSAFRTKAGRSGVKFLRSRRKLERKLANSLKLAAISKQPAYRASSLLQRQTAPRVARWLELRNTRAQIGLLRDKAYLTTPFFSLQHFHGARRVRRLARQKQQPLAIGSAVSQLHPLTANTRYIQQRRRVDFKTLIAGGQKYKTLGRYNQAVTSLPEAAAFTRGEQLTLWRPIEAPAAAERAQLPGFARNQVLRNRATAGYSRNTETPCLAGRALPSQRAGNLALYLQRSRLLEKRFYRQHTRLRLPRTVVKRAEIRRSGSRLFARNTLKLPETLAGKRKLLLPVSKGYALRNRNSYSAISNELTDLRSIRRAISDRPRVWARGPGYHESALVYDIRDKKRSASVRANLRLLKLRSKRLAAPSTAKSLTAAASLTTFVSGGATGSPCHGSDYAANAKLAVLRERILRATRYNVRRGAGQYASLVSGCTAGRTVLQRVQESSADKKQKALWHLRSVQNMLATERRLSAWSPQYPTRWRRWSSPRFEGFPAARRWPSRKLLKQRAMINAALVYRGKPKRKHFDKAYSHLQYHRGSAATVGYDRYRRSHRVKSKNNRWWKPLTSPTPFSNPYSRRSINARKYVTKRLARQCIADLGEVGARARAIKGSWFPIAQPARVISSQNIEIKSRRFERPKAFKAREKAERAKLPATLQRWTVRAEKYQFGSTSSPRKTTTLSRNARTLRRLEELYPKANILAEHTWQNLDSSQNSTSPGALYSAACRQLSGSFWNTLHQRYGTQAAATAAKRAIFARFSAWYKQVPPVNSTHGSRSLLVAAMQYILSTANALNSGYQRLEEFQYSQAVACKKDRFWRLRELPRLQAGLEEVPLLHKNNGPIYKQWLRGAERFLKRGRSSYLPPKHLRGGSGQITSFGRTRRRFPASGRRRHSYDAMLHAFARRSAPARFRRVTNLRFKQLRGKIDSGYKVNLYLHELSAALRRQRNLASKLTRVTYLSPAWRELLSYRAASPVMLSQPNPAFSKGSYSDVKRRFALLPTALLFKTALGTKEAARTKSTLALRAQRAGLLRTALRRRRQERPFIDLKKHLVRRKLPKEELSAPWRRKKSSKRKEQHSRYGDWSPRHFQLQRSKAVFWTLHDLEERVPRRSDRVRAVLSQTPSTELISFQALTPQKLGWAKFGFQLAPKEVKAHRRVRREKKRRRRGRSGITKERRARFHHSSERRNFVQLKKISGRSNRVLLKKIKITGRKFALLGGNPLGASLVRGTQLAARRWRRPAQRGLLARTQRALATNIKKLVTTTELAPTSQALYSSTSITQTKKLPGLSLRAAESRNKFTRRAFTALKRSCSTHTNTAREALVASAQLLRNFTVSATAFSPVTPLAFQKPTKRVVKSEAEKKRAIIWNIQSKERRYKRTAQYAESLTAYIPQLISHMLAQRIKAKNLQLENVKNLINATYWNLRVYLNVDPFERRLALRDSNFVFLRYLGHHIAVMAKGQVTEHADRTNLRKRFQSCRTHPAPTSDRFRLDWLRAFFPRKHALFQEDPEEYATIPVSTRNLRRLIPSGYGIGRWRTAPASVSLERRSRQLLRLRLSKCAPRFETLLQTISRTPLSEVDSLLVGVNTSALPIEQTAEQAPAAKQTAGFITSPAQQGLFTRKHSFFRRQYSTQSTRISLGVSRYISRRNRLLTTDQNAVSTFVALTRRYQLKNRLEARGRSSFTAHARWSIDSGSLDPRFLRFKSPRSRQYLLRLPASITRRSDQEKLTKFLTLRDLRDGRDSAASKKSMAESRRVRVARRYFYTERDRLKQFRVLTTLRMETSMRRRPAFLQARSAGVRQELITSKLYNFPNRRQLTPLSKEDNKLQEINFNLLRAAPHLVIEGTRSILQHRTASKRIASSRYPADRVLRRLPFYLNAEPKWAGRTGKTARSVLSRLESKRDTYLRLLRFAPDGKKGPYQVLFTRAQRALQRAQNRLAVFKVVSANTYKADSVSPRKVSIPAAFSNRAFRYIASQKRFTKRCMRLQAAWREMIYDSSRPRLWHKLTGRWMKKERLMRNWLKGVKRWFRDPWLSQSVDLTRPDRRRLLPGEVRSREQQVGEIVVGDENAGLTREEDLALQKAALPAIEAAQKVVDADRRRALELAKRASAAQKKVIRVRYAASQEALRTSRPSMWLADLQAKQKTAELAIWRTKTRKEKDAIRLAEKEAAIARAKEGLPPLSAKKDPLKVPADSWMPSIVWKDIQRRARRLEWRESDDVFARKGFRNAFRFYPSERNRAPWLESLMYNRSLFSTRLREFRRRQFPKEQKKYKWLQRVRKSLFPGKTHTYIKGRRWPRLRMYNQRLHYTLFNLPDRGAARRHFKKLNRRSRKVGFVHSQEGLSNRLDNILIHLNIAPTIFWARILAPQGLLRVNGTVVTQANYLFKAGDFIEPIWAKVLRFRHFFECPLTRSEEANRHKRFSVGGVPKNLHFHRGIRCFTFLGNPREGDLRGSSRLQPHLFRWFRLDSV